MKSFCSYFNQGICQSCGLINHHYRSQLEQKQSLLKFKLKKFTTAEPLSPIDSKEQGFRNKVKLVVSGTLENPILGLIDKEILECPVHHPKINELILRLPEFIKTAKLSPYQIGNQTGELKGVIIFVSEETNEIYLRFVLRSKEAISRLQKYLPLLSDIKVISANIQPIAHAILEGPEEIFLTNEKYINIKFDHIHFKIHPQGFVQTNQLVAKELYQTAANWIKELKAKKIVELFSGQGAFSFFIADAANEVTGVEINTEAVKRANLTAEENNLTNLNFIASDAANVTSTLQQINPELILVNPPRRGLGSAIQVFDENKPKYIIYSSCNVETLAQDLESLSKEYSVEKYQLFDMFPHTEHFESLVLLTKKAN